MSKGQLPDGIFETIAVSQGVPLLLDHHLDRLTEALATLDDPAARQRDKLRRTILRRAADKDGVALKVMVTAAKIIFQERSIPYPPSRRQRGFSLCFSEKRREAVSAQTRFKAVDRGDLDVEREDARKRGFDEVLFLNKKGHLSEGSVTNIFCVVKGKILTPPLDDGALDGVLRRYLLTTFPEIEEASIPGGALSGVDEIFVTNALMGIMPVNRLEGRALTSRHRADALFRRYHEDIIVPTLDPSATLSFFGDL